MRPITVFTGPKHQAPQLPCKSIAWNPRKKLPTKGQCYTCKIFNPGRKTRVWNANRQKWFKLPAIGMPTKVNPQGQNLDCDTRGVVYLAQCTVGNCQMCYVGMSLQPLRDRMNSHRTAVRHGKTSDGSRTGLAQHLREAHRIHEQAGTPDENLLPVTLYIIYHIPIEMENDEKKVTRELKHVEAMFIKWFHSLTPHGMNLHPSTPINLVPTLFSDVCSFPILVPTPLVLPFLPHSKRIAKYVTRGAYFCLFHRGFRGHTLPATYLAYRTAGPSIQRTITKANIRKGYILDAAGEKFSLDHPRNRFENLPRWLQQTIDTRSMVSSIMDVPRSLLNASTVYQNQEQDSGLEASQDEEESEGEDLPEAFLNFSHRRRKIHTALDDL